MNILKLDRRHFAVGFLIWAGLIFWSASQPGSGQAQAFEGLDKIQHFFAYGVLAFLLAKSIYRHFGWNSLVIVVMTTILLGVCDELYQATIPNRSSSIADVIADSIGAIMGFLSAWMWQIYNNMKRKE
ncbi:MAG: VanZ family protein [Gammaproteobacteria bacterium]|nr:VanZ family protein [Gammaproteobacteria bacterium]